MPQNSWLKTAGRLCIPLPSKGGALFTYQKRISGVTELKQFGCGLGWSESRSQPGIPGSSGAYSASREVPLPS